MKKIYLFLLFRIRFAFYKKNANFAKFPVLTKIEICSVLCAADKLCPKFKRVSLNKILEFPFWGLNIL